MQSIIIEGLDNVGKSTLIKRLVNDFPSFDVVHSGKPKGENNEEKYLYQYNYFKENMINSKNKIFDRFHLGEYVYAPLYRKYSGDYIFDLEKAIEKFTNNSILILLYINNSNLRIDDGCSFNHKKGYEEQKMFKTAFYRSNILFKQIIEVDKFTNIENFPNHYKFKSFDNVYKESLNFINNSKKLMEKRATLNERNLYT